MQLAQIVRVLVVPLEIMYGIYNIKVNACALVLLSLLM